MQQLKISKGQYIKDILDAFPNNCIVNKTIPEVGATSFFLEHESQNCIICVPNKPVITGKCKKYNSKHKTVVKGVYEGITINQITAYLNSAQTPKRFITTPESFGKIKSAIKDHEDYDLYRDFFFLMDECERLVQDVHYRDKITMPYNDFFKFEKRAMVSATTMEMTDPRFAEHNVKHISIVPDYDYKVALKLITTNNIELSFRSFIEDNPRDKYFIFHNSVDSIGVLITKLNLSEESAIFCSSESAKKMNDNHYKNVHYDLKPFKKYNFLTSRFFSALDIENIENPTIIMLTDLEFADQTAIDPLTQAIQIQGRFRKINGVEQLKELVHITNIKSTSIRNDNDILQDIETGRIIHRYLKSYLNGATTNSAVNTLRELLKTIENKMAITEDSEINHFLKDNMLFDNKIDSYYTSSEGLIGAYHESKHFKLLPEQEEYLIDDKVRIQLLNYENIRPKSLLELLVNGLEKIDTIRQTNPLQASLEEISLLHHYKEQSVLISQITLEKVRELNYDIRKVRIALKEKRLGDQLSNFEFIAYLEEEFSIGSEYSSALYKHILRRGINRFGMFALKPTLNLLKTYFNTEEIRPTRNGRRVRVQLILSRNQFNRQS